MTNPPHPTRSTVDEPSPDLHSRLRDEVGVAPAEATRHDLLVAAALAARQSLSRRWVATQSRERADKARRVYYLSMEFLIGRSLTNALDALELAEPVVTELRAHAQRA